MNASAASPGYKSARVNRYGLSFFHGNSRERVRRFIRRGSEMFSGETQFFKLASGRATATVSAASPHEL